MKLLFKDRLLLECSIPARCQETCCAEEDGEAPGEPPILRGNCYEELTVGQPRVQWSTSLRSDQFPAYAAASKSALELGSQSSVPNAFSASWADLREDRQLETPLARALQVSLQDLLEPRSEDGKSTRRDRAFVEERAEREGELKTNQDPLKPLKFLEQRHKQSLDELEQQVARESEARFWHGRAEARFRQDQAAQQEIQSSTLFEDAARKSQNEAKAATMVQEICDAESKRAVGSSQAVVAWRQDQLKKRFDEAVKRIKTKGKGNAAYEEAFEIQASHENTAAGVKDILQLNATNLEPVGSESSLFEDLTTQSRSLVRNRMYDRLIRVREQVDKARREPQTRTSASDVDPLDE